MSNNFLFIKNNKKKSDICENEQCKSCSFWKHSEDNKGFCTKYNMYSQDWKTCKSFRKRRF